MNYFQWKLNYFLAPSSPQHNRPHPSHFPSALLVALETVVRGERAVGAFGPKSLGL